jgi:hypothetical protein
LGFQSSKCIYVSSEKLEWRHSPCLESRLACLISCGSGSKGAISVSFDQSTKGDVGVLCCQALYQRSAHEHHSERSGEGTRLLFGGACRSRRDRGKVFRSATSPNASPKRFL